MEGKRLYGMKAIRAQLGRRCEKTVKRYIHRYGLPARLVGGVWEADAAELDRWREDQLVGKGG